ncbi:MAG: Ig-like domain-containing protein [Rhizobiaceae bacterium]
MVALAAMWSPAALAQGVILEEVKGEHDIGGVAPVHNGSSFNVIIDFDGDVTGFDVGDILPTNATLQNFQADPTKPNEVFSVDVVPLSNGLVELDFSDAEFVPGFSNEQDKESWWWNYDATTPGLTITGVPATLSDLNELAAVQVDFGKPVDVFELSDMGEVIGTRAYFLGGYIENIAFQGGGLYYIDVHPTGGRLSFTIPANAVKDAAGNGNPELTVSATDGVTPIPTVTGISHDFGPLSGNGELEVYGTNFIKDQTEVNFGGTNINGEDLTFVDSGTVKFTPPNVENETEVTVKVTTSQGQSTTSKLFNYYDAPTVDSDGISPLYAGVNNGRTITITGDKFIAGHTTVTLQGVTTDYDNTLGADVVNVTADRKSLSFTSPNFSTDFGGALNVQRQYTVDVTTPGGSIGAEQQITIDSGNPSFHNALAPEAVNTNFDFTIRFNKHVRGLEATDFTVNAASITSVTGQGVAVDTDYYREFKISVDPDENSNEFDPNDRVDIVFTLKAGAVEDQAANTNIAVASAATVTFDIGRSDPFFSAQFSEPINIVNNEANRGRGFTWGINFGEPVNVEELDPDTDIILSSNARLVEFGPTESLDGIGGPPIGGIESHETNYAMIIKLLDETAGFTIELLENATTDKAGNGNLGTTRFMSADLTAPKLSVSYPRFTDGLTPFTVGFQFDEEMRPAGETGNPGFQFTDIKDLTASASAHSFTEVEAGRRYTVQIQPNAAEDVSFEISRRDVRDLAYNFLLTSFEADITFSDSQPEIYSVVPGEGPVEGGTDVTISGINFSEITQVTFGGRVAESFTISGDGSEIYAVTKPAAVAGYVDVKVSQDDGKFALAEDAFNFISGDNNPPNAVDDRIVRGEDVGEITGNVLTNDTEPDGDPITVSEFSVGGGSPQQVDQTISLSEGELQIGTDGAVSFTPADNYNGEISIEYTAVDDGDPPLSDTAILTITIEPVDDDPETQNAYANGLKNAVSIPVVLRGTDVDEGESVVKFKITSVSNLEGALYGNVGLSNLLEAEDEVTAAFDAVNGDYKATVYYVPTAEFTGETTFNAAAVNNLDDEDPTPGLATISVRESNATPVANPDTATGSEDQALSIDVLANDTDADSDPLTPEIVTASASGSLNIESDNKVTYTPNENFYGTDNFTYRVYDGSEYSTAATVLITINAVNDAPITVTDSYLVTKNNTLFVPATDGVLKNDTDVDTGDNSGLTATLVRGTLNGTLTFGGDGGFTYAPDSEFVGGDSFTYRAYDGALYSATETVHIAVSTSNLNQTPMAEDDEDTTPEDQELTVTAGVNSGLLWNDTDPDYGQTLLVTKFLVDIDGDDTGDEFTVEAGGSKSTPITDFGTLTIHSDGAYSFSPVLDFNGVVPEITYTIQDSHIPPATTSAKFVITVTPENDPPVIVNPTIVEGVGEVEGPDTELEVVKVEVVDVDSTGFTFEIVAPEADDGRLFSMSDEGVLSFNELPEANNPTDVGGDPGDGIYVLNLKVTDDHPSDPKDTSAQILVTVTEGDDVAPTVTIEAPEEVRDAFEAKVIFSEPVFGFEQTDFTVENAEITEFVGADEDSVYTITLNPLVMGEVVLFVDAEVAADGSGNLNEAADPVTISYIDEDYVQDETKKIIGELLTIRGRITMDFQSGIGRRLQRLNKTYRNNGGVSAYGMNYQDGRLPGSVKFEDDKVSFAYSRRQSEAASGPPRLTGRLAVQEFGFDPLRHEPTNPDSSIPPKLSNSLGRSSSRLEENAAIHQYLFEKEQLRGGESGKSGMSGDGSDSYEGHEGSEDGTGVSGGNSRIVHSGGVANQGFTGGSRAALAGTIDAQKLNQTALSNSHFDQRHLANRGDDEKDRFDVWMEGTYGKFEWNNNKGEFGILHFGADYLFTPEVLVGLGLQVDWLEYDATDDDSGAEGRGYLIGPYVTARLAPNLLFDGRIAWGRSRNEINPLGYYTDDVDTERMLATGSFIGDFPLHENLTLLPELRLNWYREKSEDYVNSLEIEIPSVSVETGALEFGPVLRGTFDLPHLGRINPFASVRGIWTFANDVAAEDDAEDLPSDAEGVRARIDFGININNPVIAEGVLFSLSGFYDGIGGEDFKAWGGTMSIIRRF